MTDATEMPLWAAAVPAYRSGYVPIYGLRRAGGGPARLRDAELAQGMFWGGGRRFEQRTDPVPMTGLVVRTPELEQALERIRGDVWQEP